MPYECLLRKASCLAGPAFSGQQTMGFKMGGLCHCFWVSWHGCVTLGDWGFLGCISPGATSARGVPLVYLAVSSHGYGRKSCFPLALL